MEGWAALSQRGELKAGQGLVLVCAALGSARSVACLAHLRQLQAKFARVHFRVVSQEEESVLSAALKLPEARGLNVFRAKEPAVSALFKQTGAQRTPHAFVFAKDGRLLWHGEPQDHLCELFAARLDD